MLYKAAMIFILGLFWLMLSGHYSPLLLAMGAVSVALVSWIAHRMDDIDNEVMPLHLIHKLPRYAFWLVGQIVQSNLDLVVRIWRRESDVNPVLLRVPLPQRTDACRVIYANSINLTPGTLTVDMGDESLLVHTLAPQGAQSVREGEMARRVSLLEN